MARFLTPFRAFETSRGDPFMDLPREMNRLVGDVFRSMGMPAGAEGSLMAAPRIDVHETDQAIEISAELPGVNEDQVELRVDDDVLTIRGEKRSERHEGEKGQVQVSERFYGSFQRSIQLPFSPDPEHVQASFENGVLKVSLPKEERQERSHRIQIRGGSVQGSTGRAARQGNGGEGGERQQERQSPSPERPEA